jgi:flagellar basal-body rod modification protein FlgD
MSGSIAPAASQPAASSTNSSTSGSTDPLASLSGNFDDFLQMLMTQLQNQDPTSPMDTSQFTSELVEFAGVEQQIDTNTSLGQLIQLTQGGEVVQASSMLGHTVSVQSSQLTLQNGSAGVQFTAPGAGPVSIVVTDSNNDQLYATTVNATTGSNSWTWNGQNSAGNQVADGAYTVAVTEAGANGGAGTPLSFTVTGTATGVQEQGATVDLELGALSVPFSEIRSVSN